MSHRIQIQRVRFIILLLIFIAGKESFGQKETWNWYFGVMAGLNFSTGSPVPLTDGGMHAWEGTSVMSDSAGNLLFYSNGEKVWGRNHVVMPNGNYLYGCNVTSQPCVAIPKPGSQNLYYLITVRDGSCTPWVYGAFYNVIDMNLNGGLGDIVPGLKNVPIPNADSAGMNVAAIKHANNVDYWVIFRNYTSNNYLTAYLLDESGLNSEPVISDCITPVIFNVGEPQIKISPDGKYLCSCGVPGINNEYNSELYTLDAGTGKIKPVFAFSTDYWVTGLEFSANSEYLYISTYYNGFNYFADTAILRQYDMSKISSPAAFLSSAVEIYREVDGCELHQMQIGPDGKIYVSQWEDITLGQSCYYVSAINYPYERASACAFKKNAVYLNGRLCLSGLPNFIQSYFSKFDWLGACEGDTTKFYSHFLPQPDSVKWNFNDMGSGANNTSSSINPLHKFSGYGTYQVEVIAYYSNGHHETATRVVKILHYPNVNLGPDLTVCKGEIVTLNAGFGALTYLWNSGSTSNKLVTSEPGTFSVRVKNQNGCASFDTINIYNYAEATLDATNLNIAPTTCGGSTGSITGLQLIGKPPFVYRWTASGSPLSDSLDIFHLSIGLYELKVTDGNGCTIPIASYTISDAGDILLDTASVTPAYCGNNDGTLLVTAVSGLGSMLHYFIKTGSDTLSQWSNGQFSGLAGGTYYVWVSDSSGCSSVYSVPKVISELTAPTVLSAISTPETGTASDGTITINATGTGLTYSINSSSAVNSGYFSGLPAGVYTIKVSNLYGCDTSFLVNVDNTTVVHLQAIAGDGSTCLGNVAVIPLLANSFSHVSSFDSRLKYNKTLVTCQKNYLNANPALADSLRVDLFPTLGELSLTWTGKHPVNLPDGSTLVELSFASLATGQDSLKWDISPGVSTFRDSIGNSINTQFTQGQVRVYSIPKSAIQAPNSVCEGSDIPFIGVYTTGSGNGTISYQWSGPDGFTDTNPVTSVSKASQVNAGEYTLSLADTNHCQSRTSIQVAVIPLPVADFTKDTIYFDEQTELQARQGYASYTWNTGDSTSTILIADEGWYKVTIQTAEGCTTVDSVMALYSFVPLNMPNAFSPDGDGLNDVFRPVTLPEKISSFSMYIYDRWGMQVFFTNTISQGWDGAINGNPAQIGGYVYVVKYGNPSGAVREKRGMVTVVR